MLLVDTDLPAGAHTNMQPYAGRGWCAMEFSASGLVKNSQALISLKGLTGKEEELWEVRENGKAARRAGGGAHGVCLDARGGRCVRRH